MKKFKDLIVLKIGGSICTHKQNNQLKIRENILRQIAKEIKKAKSEKEFNLIIVHGAGPFGHKLVEKYGIKEGLKSKKDVKGFIETHASMERLNKKIMEIFLNAGLNVLPVQTSALIQQKNKKLKTFYLDTLENLMSIDVSIIPLLYGDMVFDFNKKATVVSGDVSAAFLAKKLKAKKLIYGTNVPGILDYSSNDQKIIKKISNTNLYSVLKQIKATKTSDVTGSMNGKILRIKEHAKGVKTFVYDMGQEGNTYKVLTKKKLICTEIYFK
ncbi:MAG: hypothetical protein COT15_02030 [Candidatus Diapherotrites archaeon CG08_land_8_20_14_0_20_34_12]|nr:MAG: hypothetical protein COT15_02030 [Candidatus Diapherotrites archaeon CG08_land_8_20_14_0_20_34_12]